MIRECLKKEIQDILTRRKNGRFDFRQSKAKLYLILSMSIFDIVFGVFLTFKYLALKNLVIPISSEKTNFYIQKSGEYKIYLEFYGYYQNYSIMPKI